VLQTARRSTSPNCREHPSFRPKLKWQNTRRSATLFHSYMAALPSIRTLADADKVLVAERCLSAYSVSGPVPPTVLVSAGERFRTWAEATYPGAVWHVEVPVSGPRSTRRRMGRYGGFGAGASGWGYRQSSITRAPRSDESIVRRRPPNSPASYQHILRRSNIAGTSIDSMWIHFPLAGVVGQAKVR
jgi:hypothetical protein